MSFEHDCVGLVMSIENAANPAYPEWSPYYGYAVGRAVWYAKHCAHQARKLGLLAEDGAAQPVTARTEAA